MSPRSVRPRRSKGKSIYGGVIFLIILIGFVLQFQWMTRMQETGSTDVVPQIFAQKLEAYMLQKKGLPPDMLSTEAKAVEQVPCPYCMEGGTIITPEGERAICPICQGVGYNVIRRFDPAEKYCPACGGMGREESLETGVISTCARCQGRGLILTHPEPLPVPEAE